MASSHQILADRQPRRIINVWRQTKESPSNEVYECEVYKSLSPDIGVYVAHPSAALNFQDNLSEFNLIFTPKPPKMIGFKLIAATAILAQTAFGEGIHLLNCRPYGGAGSLHVWYSVVAVSRAVLTLGTYEPEGCLYLRADGSSGYSTAQTMRIAAS